MVSNDCSDDKEVKIGGTVVKVADDFCYLRSFWRTAAVVTDCQRRIDKAKKLTVYLEDWSQSGTINTYQLGTKSETVWVISYVDTAVQCGVMATVSHTKENKCVSKTDTNPPFAFQIAFPRGTDFTGFLQGGSKSRDLQSELSIRIESRIESADSRLQLKY